MAFSMSVASVGQNSATINWSVSGISSTNYAWDVFFTASGGTLSQSGFGPYSTSTQNGSFTITGLASGTSYQVNGDLTLQNGNVGGGSTSTSFTTTSPPVTYTGSWDLAGGSGGGSYPTSVTAGSSISAPGTNPTRSGYTFSGWSVGFPYTPTGSGWVISASWTANATYPPTWTDNTLGSAQTTVAYSDGVSATNMNYSGSYSVSAGTLPAGLSLNTASGAITGTPTTAGSFNFTITATNSYGSISQAFTFVVSVAPSGAMNVYNGSTFVQAPVYVYNGTTWVQGAVYVWNGSSWVMAL